MTNGITSLRVLKENIRLYIECKIYNTTQCSYITDSLKHATVTKFVVVINSDDILLWNPNFNITCYTCNYVSWYWVKLVSKYRSAASETLRSTSTPTQLEQHNTRTTSHDSSTETHIRDKQTKRYRKWERQGRAETPHKAIYINFAHDTKPRVSLINFCIISAWTILAKCRICSLFTAAKYVFRFILNFCYRVFT